MDARTLDRQVAALLRLDDIEQASDLRRLSPPRARARVREQIKIADAEPPAGVISEDRTLLGGLSLRSYRPETLIAPSPAVFYLHGGGWVTGSIATHDGLCRRIALGARCRVFALQYRLAPENPFPTAVDDVVAAFRWVTAQAHELEIDPFRIAVGGDSAGGNLSAVLCRHTKHDPHPPAVQILLYPALDATCSLPSHETMGANYFLTREMIEWYLDHYVGDRDRRHPDLSPLLAEDLQGVAPARIYTAGFDPLRDEGRMYAERLRAAGVAAEYREFETLIHGFALMTRAVSTARAALDSVIADIEHALHS